ncbi:beta 1,4 glucosyltransferase [Alkalihalobacillus alcalophilus ATCC 27647 = CGMCC 1.3604]|uniref:Beta 1,4 glucosyltransferase n=1 Tax=Alkalihalobacillus alcalophilus ATCC 27647 = CGMCC 1.3604 TaxID=1218173 RepID=A0A094WMX6_ALKAL|nr:glycosyltransferase [Alkalihalobacillus alcalophilus]KGA97303.1 glycosyl transferase [Alkalihalobacillus alcalophilus ATCC 27647 = CGMCC 1.3604]MED1562520.1 glycosyltransferase [Alkalihalobacillus alcalophilus]THG92141.1 beta 1,4 glucosyltransferase [Alkalihalobacillus alcalophilus ATCC 27647 = CGMCC 1.3604]
MVTISLCMIVKNEEEVLARGLDTVKDIVDEINIVDTGSTDRTVEIAKQYTDRVFFYEWTGNFAAARNESFKYATKDYILYLDADDVLLKEDQKKLKELKKTLNLSVDSVSMFYNAGMDQYGNVTLRYRRNRLVKRENNFKWEGDVHNYLNVYGKIINSDVAITHKKLKHSVSRNLSIYKEKLERGDVFSARDYFYYGNELRENGFPKEAIEAYEKNIAKKDGWSEDKFYACLNKADCHRHLGELDKELESLFQSFAFSKTPRPEVCSRIGYHNQQKGEYEHAVYWYEQAIELKPDLNQWSFSYPAYSTWYPHLQLCVCYDKLGNYNKSYYHNEKAGEYRPEDPSVLHNKAYLESKLGSKKKKVKSKKRK